MFIISSFPESIYTNFNLSYQYKRVSKLHVELYHIMEFISEEYKRCIVNVVTTTDGYKYVQSKVTE